MKGKNIFRMRFSLIALLLLLFPTTALSDNYWTATVQEGGLQYTLDIRGYMYEAVAVSASASAPQGFSGFADVQSSVSYEYTWKEQVSPYEYVTHSRTLTAPVDRIAGFSGCTGLTGISIPGSVTSIVSNAFSGCTGLTGISIPGSVKEIGAGAFANCTGLTHITIPESVVKFETLTASFIDCTGLKSVKIMSSLNGMERFHSCYSKPHTAFEGCTNIERIEYHSSCILPLFNFTGMDYLKEIVIGQEVDTIGAYAFRGCEALEEIFIPKNVKMIQEKAFYGCNSLSKVEIEDIDAWCSGLDFGLYHRRYGDGGIDGPIGYWFQDCYPDDKFGFDVNLSNGGDNPLVYAQYLYLNGQEITDLIIPETVDSITSTAFWNCYSLKKIDTGNHVKGIGAKAFWDCVNLEELTIGENVEWLETPGYIYEWYHTRELVYSAFGYPHGDASLNKLNKLTWNAINCRTESPQIPSYNANDVVIGEKVKVLPDGIASGSKIKKIIIPSSVEQISGSFTDCDLLTKVIWNAKNCVYHYYHNTPFEGCSNLRHIIIDAGVEAIGDLIFNQNDRYNNIDTVSCYAAVPPAISKRCFTDRTYNNAVLCVPEGSIEAYRNSEGWKEFFKIVTVVTIPGDDDKLAGDVNDDGKVNIEDVTALINYLLTGDASGINLENADVDGDGKINIEDVTSLITILLTSH